jgi:hypothetical protein
VTDVVDGLRLLLEALLLPYLFIHRAVGPGPAPWETWAVTWAAGTTLLLFAWVAVAHLWIAMCHLLTWLVERVHRRADRGADLTRRRRNAANYLLVHDGLQRLERAAGAVGPRARSAGRHDPVTENGWLARLARLTLWVPRLVVAALGTAAATITSRYGALTAAAALWVCYPNVLQRTAERLVSQASTEIRDIPLPAYALAVAVVALYLTHLAAIGHRGITKWRVDQAATAYTKLNEVFVIADELRIPVAKFVDDVSETAAATLAHLNETLRARTADHLSKAQRTLDPERTVEPARLRQRLPAFGLGGYREGEIRRQLAEQVEAGVAEIHAIAQDKNVRSAIRGRVPRSGSRMLESDELASITQLTAGRLDPFEIDHAVESWECAVAGRLDELMPSAAPARAMAELADSMTEAAVEARASVVRSLDEYLRKVCLAEARLDRSGDALHRTLYPQSVLGRLRRLAGIRTT